MQAGQVKTQGFRRSDVHLGNWRTRPYNTWAFSHVSEIVPSARIRAEPAQPDATLPADPAFLNRKVVLDGEEESVQSFLTRSETDILLVKRDGRMLARWHAPHAEPALPHILFSVTKSITGLLCGMAQEMSLLDPDRPVGDYLPETRAGAYGDCLVRHVLDMRVSLDFEESYLDKTGGYARYRRAVLWNPAQLAEPVEGLRTFLNSVGKAAHPHGRPFAYLSPNSDMLGLLLEHVTGERHADFIARCLWEPMGAMDDAFMTVDAFGAPRGAGGLSCSARDLARIGELMLEPGDVLSERWVAETWISGDREAWDAGDFRDFIPGGAYANQWYLMPPPADALLAVGIHGQFLYIHRPTRTVIVKMASQNLPLDSSLDAANLEFLHQLTLL